jgi:predicted glycoside hydrolase/deacetylase ChbG (UPF0249 family)
LFEQNTHITGEEIVGRATKSRSIIVCADDFGINPAVDDGILSLAALNRLSVVSCMSLGASFAHHAEALRASRVGMGLHLDLTEMPSGMKLSALITRAYADALDAAWVDERIARQLDAYENICGAAPAYVDGHQHVHQLPTVLPRLLRALDKRYLRRPWLRCTLPAPGQRMGFSDTFKAHVIGILGGNALRVAAREHGWRCNRNLLGVYGLRGGAWHYADLLQRWFAAARHGDLLMCHPAAPVGNDDPWQRQRAAEREVWAGSEVEEWLRSHDLKIARMGA